MSAYVRTDSVNAVVFRSSTDSHIREFSLPSGWIVSDLTAASHAVASASAPSAYARADGVNAVVFLGSDANVYEISRPSAGTTWSAGNLTSISGAALAASSNAGPVGYVRADGVNAVVYRGSDGHVEEISIAPGGPWSFGDLSQITGAAAAVGTPRPYSRCDAASAVVYRDGRAHIQEISLAVGGSWSVGDLTTAAGGSVAVSDPAPYVRADNVNAVVYRSSDGHIHEISCPAAAVHGPMATSRSSPALRLRRTPPAAT